MSLQIKFKVEFYYYLHHFLFPSFFFFLKGKDKSKKEKLIHVF